MVPAKVAPAKNGKAAAEESSEEDDSDDEEEVKVCVTSYMALVSVISLVFCVQSF